MNDADRRKVTEALQRDVDRIADAAVSEARAGFVSRPGNGPGWSPAPEALREGFVHLGGTVALAVLVDEPGLIADDLSWLRRMMGARGMQLDPPTIDLLFQSYLDACSSILQ